MPNNMHEIGRAMFRHPICQSEKELVAHVSKVLAGDTGGTSEPSEQTDRSGVDQNTETPAAPAAPTNHETRPSDLITTAVVTTKYSVGRTTLKTAVKERRLTKYRRAGAASNTTNRYSEKAVAREFPLRKHIS